MRIHRCLGLVGLLLLMRAAAAGPATVHEYTVTIDYSLSSMWVEARFEHAVDTLTAKARDASKYLLDIRDCRNTGDIRMRNRRMLLPEDGIDCLNYTVDLARAARDNRRNRTLAEGNLIVSPSVWLWRPELTGTTELRVRFRIPEGATVSVPWELVDPAQNTYRLRRSPESSNAPAVFGAFDHRLIEVAGASLRVAILSGSEPVDHEQVASWIRAAAADVSLAYGRFPHPSPQIVVIPVGDSRDRGDSAVPFGQVIRDGGETVQLYINQHESLDAFLDDWTATHEFSHLLLPHLERRHKWISEGFAQYYQNVLLARSGAYDAQRSWQKLYEGLERGRMSRPELSPNEAAEGGVRTALMKVYWSGAAIALIADVSLRERSAGGDSLDAVLDRFQACCLPSDRSWSGTELFTTLDRLTDHPVFMSLYRRYADTAGFPDTGETFERLGLAVSDGKVQLKRHGELKAVRQAITATDAAAAQWRQQLAANP